MSDDPHAAAIAEHLVRQAQAHPAHPDPDELYAAGVIGHQHAVDAPVDLATWRDGAAADPPSQPAPVHLDPHAKAIGAHAALIELLEDGHELAADLRAALDALGPVAPGPWGARLTDLARDLPAGIRVAVIIEDSAARTVPDLVDRLGDELRQTGMDLKASRDQLRDRVTIELAP